jgi:hypothetical protein
MRTVVAACVALVGSLSFSSPAHADGMLFTASGTGNDDVTLYAYALFSISVVDGAQVLTVSLMNMGDTAGTGKDVAANTLTGLFFDLPDGITLTPLSATANSIVQAGTCDVGTCTGASVNVGGEFAMATGAFTGHLGNVGISSSGYIGTSTGNFNGPNLDDPDAPNGINFGIVAPSPLYSFNPNGGLDDDPLINGTVVFTLAISGGKLLESQITNVSFQYGTNLSEPQISGGSVGQVVPEPSTFMLLGSALVVATGRLARFRMRGTFRRKSKGRSNAV